MIADDLGIDGLVTQAGMAARVHDIGKIGIPREVLNKPGQLTEEELALVRTHPKRGRRILEPVPFFAELLPGVYGHHERFDGSGSSRWREDRALRSGSTEQVIGDRTVTRIKAGPCSFARLVSEGSERRMP